MAARPQRQTGLSAYARLLTAAAGGLILLLGIIAVFTVFNPAGTIALLVVGLVFALVAIVGRLPGPEGFGGRRVEPGGDALAELLGSSDPRVKRAVAEAVLQREAAAITGDGPVDSRDAALAVLLERDSIRRLSDLLTRYGFTVSTGEAAGQQALGADLLVGSGTTGAAPVPIELVSTRPDSPATLQRLGSLADLLHSQAAVVVHTGARGANTPLPTVTPIGTVQVFSVHSARLVDEAEVVSAVQRAVALADAAAGPDTSPTSSSSPAPRTEHRNGLRVGAESNPLEALSETN